MNCDPLKMNNTYLDHPLLFFERLRKQNVGKMSVDWEQI